VVRKKIRLFFSSRHTGAVVQYYNGAAVPPHQTLIFRDWWLTTVISVMFEFLEYSLEHQLPNFSECWWDKYDLHNSQIRFSNYLLFGQVGPLDS
jgi:hypothetical protein